MTPTSVASLSVSLPDSSQLKVPIVRSKRRTLALHVLPGRVEIRAPLRCSVATMSKFLESKADWLGRAMEQMSSMPKRKNALSDGDSVLVLGNEVILCVRRGEKEGVVFRASKLYVTVSATIFKKELQARVMSLIEHWYRKRAAELILPRVKELSRRIRMRPRSVRIGRARSSWGRCVQGGHLHFTWHLLKAPQRIIDSVVIHELCHLEEMNHSRKFWDLVARHDPDHLKSQEWLKANASLLLG